MILGISGYATSGKDEFAEVFLQHGFEKRGFADKLREFVLAIDPIIASEVRGGGHGPAPYTVFMRYSEILEKYGYTEAKAKFKEFRDILQRVGTDGGRNVLGENVWVDAAIKSLDSEANYIFTDVRFPNEFKAIQKAGGATVRINRPGVGPVNDHPSETAVDHMDYDYVVENDGSISDLQEKAITVLEREINEVDWKVLARQVTTLT